MIVTIPKISEHGGFLGNLVTIAIPDACPICGQARGTNRRVGKSYDGSRQLPVTMWLNACGHVDKYSKVIDEFNAARANGEPWAQPDQQQKAIREGELNASCQVIPRCDHLPMTQALVANGVDFSVLQDLMDDIHRFSDQTFGDSQRFIPIVRHLEKEIRELGESLMIPGCDETKYKEISDCFILLLDLAKRIGMNAPALVGWIRWKHGHNLVRQWGGPDDNGVIEHIPMNQVGSVQDFEKGEQHRGGRLVSYDILVEMLIRASWLIGNPGTGVSASTDMACDAWQKDFKSIKKSIK